MKNTTFINGREATTIYMESESSKIPSLYNYKVMVVLEVLLEGDRSRKYEQGITTLKTFQTMQFNNLIGSTRVSNFIIPLRKALPKGAIITFRYKGEKQGRYALVNDSNIIDFSDNLLNEIREKISKDVQHKIVV